MTGGSEKCKLCYDSVCPVLHQRKRISLTISEQFGSHFALIIGHQAKHAFLDKVVTVHTYLHHTFRSSSVWVVVAAPAEEHWHAAAKDVQPRLVPLQHGHGVAPSAEAHRVPPPAAPRWWRWTNGVRNRGRRELHGRTQKLLETEIEPPQKSTAGADRSANRGRLAGRGTEGTSEWRVLASLVGWAPVRECAGTFI
jgi:hypothetical protein